VSQQAVPLAAALADRYTVERELGRGGMATVYLAEEKKHGRKVAIKVLRPEITAALGTERFLREIGIAARLSHPHIVPLIDSGDAGGLLYYVQPYVPGGSLRERLAEAHQLSLTDALRIPQEVGAGLDFAHRNGFVHRDVKPENILFADGHAVLADFGVARACCDAETQERVTEVGLAVGTPEYMSPEQASGQADLGAASDVYSLACVVYEMLAGEPPFRGSSPRAVMARQVTESPRPLRAFRPEVPLAVERTIIQALEKNPDQRINSAAEFVSALLAADTPQVGRTPAITRSIAVLPFVNASSDAENEYLSDGITDELIDALAKIAGLRVSSRTSTFALKGKPLDVRAVGALLGASVVLEGTVRRSATSSRRLRRTRGTHPRTQGWPTPMRSTSITGRFPWRRRMPVPRSMHAKRWRSTSPCRRRTRHWPGVSSSSTGIGRAPIGSSAAPSSSIRGMRARINGTRFSWRRAIEMNPMAVESYRILGSTLGMQRQWAEAERILRDALALPGAGAYTKATVAFAILHVGLGNVDRALDWAERAYDERRGWLAYFKVNPMLDPLRSESRFKSLIDRMRL